MRYAIHYHPLVIRDDIPKLDVRTKQRIKISIEEKLTTHPEIFGVPLRQSLKGHRKLRLGDYRVVFQIAGSRVIVGAILHRSVVYTIAEHRAGRHG